MQSPSLIDLANLCQALIMPICASAYVPQWKTIITNKSSLNISLSTYLLWTFSSLLAMFYAAAQYLSYHTGVMLVVSTALNLCCLFVSVFLILFYKPEKRQSSFAALSLSLENISSTTEDLLTLKQDKHLNKTLPSSTNLKSKLFSLSSLD